MNIFLNQEEITIIDSSSILDLVMVQNLPLSSIAVAVNNQIIKRDMWESTKLMESDRVTIIIATFGG